MRNNQPTTSNEYRFPAGQTLVSTTDLKGRIVYCNATFITVSGFDRDELLGQPHNIVRHPDMPEEAFRDMWETISSGQPWSAPVKNRRKDGSFYWVMANVTPLMDGDRPAGFMSVRTQPTPEQVEEAEALYRLMREEKAAGRQSLVLRNARPMRTTGLSHWARQVKPSPAVEVAMICAAIGVLAASGTAAATGADLGTWLGASATAGLAGATASSMLVHRLVRPVQQLVRVANRIAAGDLTQQVQINGDSIVDRLGKALGQLNVNLRSIVRDARDEVVRMHAATQEIAASNQDLSVRTESQAASLQETASSMEQITSAALNNVESARKAATLAQESSGVTQRAGEAMVDVTRAMQVIAESSRRISEIVHAIDSIAFQTNILALNAAVEAARAGDHGRGFAVVASNVRALAQSTSDSAREIKRLIGESGDSVAEGTRLVDEAQRTMSGVMSSVGEVTAVVRQISHAAEEQLVGITQINEAVSQLDTITQQNAALVEQVAAAAVQLQHRGASVNDCVSVFRLDAGALAEVDAVALRSAAKATAHH